MPPCLPLTPALSHQGRGSVWSFPTIRTGSPIKDVGDESSVFSFFFVRNATTLDARSSRACQAAARKSGRAGTTRGALLSSYMTPPLRGSRRSQAGRRRLKRWGASLLQPPPSTSLCYAQDRLIPPSQGDGRTLFPPDKGGQGGVRSSFPPHPPLSPSPASCGKGAMSCPM